MKKRYTSLAQWVEKFRLDIFELLYYNYSTEVRIDITYSNFLIVIYLYKDSFVYRDISDTELKLDITLGYYYFLDSNHPLRHKSNNKVYYHRHVASIALGRWVTGSEVVHHIDENKANNSPANLAVMTCAEHAALHNLESKMPLTCAVCGAEFSVQKSHVSRRKTCSKECSAKYSTVWEVSKEVLEMLIWNISYTKLASIVGISDVGIRKKAIRMGCRLPPPYFFNKTELFRKTAREENNISDLSPQQSSKLLA